MFSSAKIIVVHVFVVNLIFLTNIEPITIIHTNILIDIIIVVVIVVNIIAGDVALRLPFLDAHRSVR